MCATVKLSPSTEWTSTTADFRCTNGTHALYFTYRGDGSASLLDFEIE